jgi:hypothetical protein
MTDPLSAAPARDEAEWGERIGLEETYIILWPTCRRERVRDANTATRTVDGS